MPPTEPTNTEPTNAEPTEPDRAPVGVEPDDWAKLRTADAFANVPVRDPSSLSRRDRTFVTGLLSEVCGGDRCRADEVLTAALRDGIPVSAAWLALREEWAIRERLLTVNLTVPGTGDHLGLREQRNGKWKLAVSFTGGADVEITVPANLLAYLVHRYTIHDSPVTTTAPDLTRTTKGSPLNKMVDAIVAVDTGDIVLCGSSYFHVTDVRAPQHPAAPGVVWHGSWWNSADGVWREPTIWHITPDNCPHVPQILSPQDRERLGWGDLT